MKNSQFFYGSSDREAFNDFLRNHLSHKNNAFIITDTNCEKHCLSLFLDQFPILKNSIVITIPVGENHKTIDSCELIWKSMLDENADRNALVLNLGGGVVGDVGGYAASTFKRGVNFINIPTTLLAQVDASVGGKTGVNFQGIKNIIGTFNRPLAVYTDVGFLKTLPENHFRSGMAEVLKHGLIFNRGYWNETKDFNNEKTDIENMVKQSVEIKNMIVGMDMHETNIRKILNFGHTIGHAVESVSMRTNRPLLHGEAIAIGMICEAYLSNKLSALNDGQLAEITEGVLNVFPDLDIEELAFGEMLDFMKNDKKNRGEVLRFSLLNNIGAAIFNHPVNAEQVEESLNYYKSSKSSRA